MSEVQSIQWFPGHMTRTRRQIEKCLPKVDMVAEIIDARVPVSSRNPVLQQLIRGKPRMILMNKCDMADPAETAKWVCHYKEKGITALEVDCKTGRGVNRFAPAVREVLRDRIAVWESKGMVGRPIRVMVVGIPNVGKSSLINKLCKGIKGKAEVQDRPGVTRENRWFTIGNGLELLDTPGVLWPKFEDKRVGERLAFTGAVKDDILDREHLAARLLECLGEGRYTGEAVAAAGRLAGWCGRALAAAALCQLGHNLLQLLFAPTLSAMDLSVQLPLLGVVFLLAALLLARLVARGYRLQQDNDLFI